MLKRHGAVSGNANVSSAEIGRLRALLPSGQRFYFAAL
jgi:hypothetical protein